MIPETSANQTVELYQAEDFPMKWKKVSNLITGERYVDTSVVKQGDAYFAVSYKKNEHGWSLDAFSLDMENNQMTKLGSKTYKTNTGRPGGGFICGENLERPAQNCASKYGENLIIYKIDQLDGIGYEEHEVGKVTVHDIPMKSAPNRVHTYESNKDCDWAEVKAALENKQIQAKTLISHTYTADRLEDGLELMRSHQEPYCKVMTVWGND